MKNVLLILLTIVFTGLNSYSQSFALFDANEKMIKNNDTIVLLYDKETSDEEILYFKISNSTNQDLNLIIEKDDVALQSGTLTYFCFGTTCYTPFASTSDTEVVSANSVDDSFSTYFVPDNVSGDSYVIYSVINADNQNETLMFYIKYSSDLGVGITSLEKEQLEVYFDQPNKNLYVKDLASQNSQLSIYTLSGVLVEEEVINGNQTMVDLNSCSSGIYVYKVELSNGQVKSGKIIIE